MKQHETLEHLSFDATISVLDAETSALGAVTRAIARRSFRATILPLDAEMSVLDADTSTLDAETSAITRSYWCGVFGDCGVGVTPQMYNRVTNHGDMGSFSKPACWLLLYFCLGIINV